MSPKQHALNVLRYWALVEEFTPPEIEKEYEKDPTKSIQREVFEDQDIPWLHKDRFTAHKNTKNEEWEYTLFLGFNKVKTILAIIKNLFSDTPEGYREQKNENKNTCLLAFKVDVNGKPLKNSLAIPDYVVALGCVTQCDPPSIAAINQKSKDFISEKLTDTYYNLCDELNQKKQVQPIDSVLLNRLLQDVLKIIGWDKIAKPDKTAPQNLIVAHGKKTRRASQGPDKPFLGSLFIKYINEVIKKWEKDPTQISKPLQQYLASAPTEQRKDLTDNSVLRQYVSPQYLAPARWPCAGDFPLSISQQAAINLALNETSGIFSVNGPPGTGKTTLLNDIISNVIVKRAEAIAHLNDPTDAFEQKAIETSIDRRKYYVWKPKPVLQGYEIVIASNNNKAVENISKEIPSQQSVDPQWELDYFADLAQHILNMPDAWGLCAAVLGKRTHITNFFNKFWQSDSKAEALNFNSWLLTRLKEGKAETNWKQAKKAFQNTLKAYKALQKELADVAQDLEQLLTTTQKLQHDKAEHEAILQSLEDEKIALKERCDDCTEQLNRLQSHRPGKGNYLLPNKEYQQWEEGYKKARNADKAAQKEWKACEKQIQDVRSGLEQLAKKQAQLQQKAGSQEKYLMYYKERIGSNFPDSTFWQQPTEVLQQSTPWHSERLHELRGELFVRAMDLHRAFIGRTAKQFHNNLSSIKALVGDGKSWPNNKAGERAQDVLPALWTSLFTVVPVVSTTLASIGNLKGLGKEGISWVLIDEAGQAAPQAAVGVLQRARRAIVVGDPNQTPPTVTLPPKMSEVFRAHYQLDVQWDIHETSAQSLADEANIFGAYINQGGITSWVGAPLRVHRRCQNPMFEVANQIAYDGLMVQATSPEISPLAQALRTEKLPEGNCWFDVQGRLSGTKHWITEEGNRVLAILQRLCEIEQQLPNVYIITPFKNIAERMKALLRDYKDEWSGRHIDSKKVYEWISESVGTIHTFQGKEADGVILVLGASDNVNARNWVASSPNILNVALTRAKDFCLVVGDYNVWSQHDHFRILANALPPHPKRKK